VAAVLEAAAVFATDMPQHYRNDWQAWKAELRATAGSSIKGLEVGRRLIELIAQTASGDLVFGSGQGGAYNDDGNGGVVSSASTSAAASSNRDWLMVGS
jgi:hypothetical protein